MTKQLKNKPWNKNSVRIYSNGNEFDFRTKVNKSNCKELITQQVKMLNAQGISIDFAIAYPEDGDPVIASNSKKYATNKDLETSFPELFEEVA
jgi:hypothetical protein|tara:strand:- start:297 stop:575 length:279 start_codon:yes stop_codon:yes gene_type:complete